MLTFHHIWDDLKGPCKTKLFSSNTGVVFIQYIWTCIDRCGFYRVGIRSPGHGYQHQSTLKRVPGLFLGTKLRNISSNSHTVSGCSTFGVLLPQDLMNTLILPIFLFWDRV